jgi:hypothetical protein
MLWESWGDRAALTSFLRNALAAAAGVALVCAIAYFAIGWNIPLTLLSDKAMTPDQFYEAFLAILQVHGFVAVPSGNVIKILPDANMRQMPGNDLPSHVSATSDEVVTQVMSVKNGSSRSVKLPV